MNRPLKQVLTIFYSKKIKLVTPFMVKGNSDKIHDQSLFIYLFLLLRITN
jgi:hypothetical protein